jgi:hypothetical protein
VEVKEQYQAEILNSFAALESLDESFDINNAWESIRGNIKTSAKDNLRYQRLKHTKHRFDDECSKLTDQRKQYKLQCLQNPNQIIGKWPETRRCSIDIAFRFCFRICHQGRPIKSNRFGIKWDTLAIDLY